jgi:dienelactone hydrolase
MRLTRSVRGVRRGALLFCALALLVGLAAPAGATSAPAQRRGHTFWYQTFVDTSRSTVPSVGPPIPTRTLLTAIYRPNRSDRHPVIVFAHGLLGHPEKFTKLFSVWADAGYVVVAPAFPLTNDHAPSINVADLAQQPGDMSFVLDQVLALSGQRGSRLYHSIDARRIGAAGLSLGGITTYLFAYGDCCRDNRVDAVEILDGINPGVTVDGHVPFFIAHSDTDPALPYSTARTAYEQAQPPAWFMTLHGAAHATQWEDDVTPYDHIAEQTTTDFWNATLKRHRHAFSDLQRDATVSGLASIEHK